MQGQLTIDRLTARYGDRTIVSGLTFAVPAGEVLALRGRNGSGKSTILRAIVDPRARASGRVLLDGRELKVSEVGYVPQQSILTLFPWTTGAENIGLWRRTHGLDWNETDAAALAAEHGLSVPLDRPIYQLSGGERVQIAVLRSLAVREMKLWVLDEPTEGLDRAAQEILRDVIRRVAHAGVTVILTTHRNDDLTSLNAHVRRVTGSPINELVADEDAVEPASSTRPNDLASTSSPGASIPARPSLKYAGVMGLAAGILLWMLMAKLVDSPMLIPAPFDVVMQLINMGAHGDLARHVGATLARAFGGWALGVALATPLALIVGYDTRIAAFCAPWLSVGRTFPVFCLTGVALGLFPGASELQRAWLISLSAFLIQLQIVSSAAARAPRRRIDIARLFGASASYRIFSVLQHEVRASILGGLEATLPLAVIITLVVETFLIPNVGLGRFVQNALNGSAASEVVAAVIIPASVAAIGVQVLRRVGNRSRLET